MCTNTSYDVGYKKQHKKPSYFTSVSATADYSNFNANASVRCGEAHFHPTSTSTSSLRSSFERSGRANDHPQAQEWCGIKRYLDEYYDYQYSSLLPSSTKLELTP
eukprot:scaffold6289_cov109-Skeletonema_dohrnii-CCMP3373.AAC.4